MQGGGPQVIEMEPDERGNIFGVTRVQALKSLIDWHYDQAVKLDNLLCEAEEEEAKEDEANSD